ncbi:MAG: carboxypeptidase-like regulatory domain-containing protein, partial [Bacteroidota bacterium]
MRNILQLTKVTKTLTSFVILIISFGFCSELYAQDITLSGVVKDADGEVLPGVTILQEGTSNGTITDAEGSFRLNVPSNAVLQVSYIGFQPQTIPVNGRTQIEISLEDDLAELEEVVVIGYGTQKKSHLTGAVSKVTNTKLDQLPVARVDDALIGQISGINIQATNAEAGGAPTITIRGVQSITGDSGPAVVVDGIIVDRDFLSNLDMNDIASFEVLKDAASAAIYGTEGANGVIMITTKDGQAGRTRFSYQTYVGRKEAHGSDDYRKNTADWVAFEQAQTG